MRWWPVRALSSLLFGLCLGCPSSGFHVFDPGLGKAWPPFMPGAGFRGSNPVGSTCLGQCCNVVRVTLLAWRASAKGLCKTAFGLIVGRWDGVDGVLSCRLSRLIDLQVSSAGCFWVAKLLSVRFNTVRGKCLFLFYWCEDQ